MNSDTARRSDACPMKIIRFRHSSLIDRTKRSAYAFRFGDIGGSRMTSIPDSRTNRRNWSVYLVSRGAVLGRGPLTLLLDDATKGVGVVSSNASSGFTV